MLILFISVDTGNSVEEKYHRKYLEIFILLIIHFLNEDISFSCSVFVCFVKHS